MVYAAVVSDGYLRVDDNSQGIVFQNERCAHRGLRRQQGFVEKIVRDFDDSRQQRPAAHMQPSGRIPELFGSFKAQGWEWLVAGNRLANR